MNNYVKSNLTASMRPLMHNACTLYDSQVLHEWECHEFN